jgi:thiol-disulfide isomerase/thioredoxin
MKSVTLIFALALIAHTYAQNQASKPLAIEDQAMDQYLASRKIPELKIKIIDSEKSLQGLQIKYSLVHLGAEIQTTNYTSVDDKGEVIIRMTENLPYQQVWLDIEGYLYTGVLVNAGLEIIIDAGETKDQVFVYGKGISFKGYDAALNESLCKRMLYKSELDNLLSGRLVSISIDAANKKLEQSVFLTIADSIYTALKHIYDDFVQDNPEYEWAVRNETDSKLYCWAVIALKRNTETINSLYQRAISHKPYFMSNEGAFFYQRLGLNYAFEEEKTAPGIQQLLYSKYDTYNSEQKAILDSIKKYESSRAEGRDTVLKKLYISRYKLLKEEVDMANFERYMLKIQENATNPRADILKLSLMELGKDHFNKTYPMLLHSMKTNWAKQIVQNTLQQFTDTQKEVQKLFQSAKQLKADSFFIGKPVADLSFGAQLYRLDSIANIDAFIFNLKSKFKDKALIIDIWGTWCAPCISDMPSSKKLHEENKDLPIEYIYLCTTSGSDAEIWKNRVGSLKVPGTHIFINEELETELRKKLNAEGGYPTYVVIDKNGSISSKSISFMGGLNRETLMQVTGLK